MLLSFIISADYSSKRPLKIEIFRIKVTSLHRGLGDYQHNYSKAVEQVTTRLLNIFCELER